MSNSKSCERPIRSALRYREYVVGNDTDCRHPAERREYLGSYARGSYFQCRQCKSVIVGHTGDA